MDLGKLPKDVIDRVWISVICIETEFSYATGIVFDKAEDSKTVYVLSNFHTWDDISYKKILPFDWNGKVKMECPSKKRKHTTDAEEISVTLKNHDGKTICHQNMRRDMFHCYDFEDDYAVIKFTFGDSSSIQRIPISYNITETMEVHAFGYVGYLSGNEKGNYLITNDEITRINERGFQMSSLSAQGLSGSAIIADKVGRAVGYLGGNIDASKEKIHNISHMDSLLVMS